MPLATILQPKAARSEPKDPDALNALGISRINEGRLEEAVWLFRRALRLDPEAVGIHNNLGVTLAKQGKHAEAVNCFRKVLQLKPSSPEAYSNLGLAYLEEGRSADAVQSFRDVLRLNPDAAEAFNNLGVALLQHGQPEEAAASYQKALELNPHYDDAKANLSRAWLVQGDFERGFPQYEWRWQTKDSTPRPFTQPQWDGSALAGRTILLHAEQGFGDTLQFIRFAPVVKQYGGRVVCEVPRPLLNILARCKGVDQWVEFGSSLPDFDVHAPLLSLPRILKTSLRTIPATVPYLQPDPELVKYWRRELGGVPGFKIGIVWQGNPNYRGDRLRSVPLRQFEALAKLPGVRLFSLQKKAGTQQISEVAERFAIHDLGRRLDESTGPFMDTAAVMKVLDLIVTSDTAIPHLAGALGVPVWLATPFAPDWRWLRKREDSPWYPTMRLFRQPKIGDWESVFARMAAELQRRLQKAKPASLDGLAAHADSAHQRGLALVKENKLAEAVPHLERALLLKPELVDACHNLGVAWARQGQLDRAVGYFKQVLQRQPDSLDANANIGLALLRQGKFADSIGHFERVLRHKPDASDVHHHLGNALRFLNRMEEAIAAYRQAVRHKPDFAEAYQDLGIALGHQHQIADAITAYREAVRIRPNFPEAHNNLGILLEEGGKLDEAIEHFHYALKINPNSSETHSNLGVALAAQGKTDEALKAYEEALRLKPDSPEAHNNLGNTLRTLGRLDEAVSHFDHALRVKPDYAEAYNNVGIVLVHQGKMAEGMACYDRALELKPDYPDARLNRSLGYLALGDLERGWDEYEWRWRGKNLLQPRKFNKPRWDGTPLTGRTILLYPEQGLGDSLQFIRYARLLKQMGARVVFECPKALLRLLARTADIDLLVEQGKPVPDFDLQAPLLSLPGLLKTRMHSIPAQVPYLSPDPQLLEQWAKELKNLPGFKIGIAWQGNPQYRGDRHRSVPLKMFAPIARIPGVQLFSLQKGFGTQQLAEVADQFTVHDLSRRLDEAAGPFMDTAAVMKVLDLVITSDTAIPHLAGALGVPVWMATPYAADWRWLRQGEDSPWYPTMQLFRQPQFGDWESVFARIAQQLQARLQKRPAVQADGGSAVAAEAAHQQGIELVKQGRLEEAVVSLERALWLKPDLVEAAHNLGVAFARLGKLDHAIVQFKEVLRLQPDSVEAIGNLGLAYLKHHVPNEALPLFQRLLRMKGDSPETHNHIGVALADLGRNDEALVAYQKAIELKPGFADALNNLGNLQRNQGRLYDAIDCYDRALHSNPQEPEIHNNLGIARSQQGRFAEAIANFRATLELKPDHADALNNLGVAHQDSGQMQEAISKFQEVIRLQPDNAGAHKNLALAWLRVGNYEQGWAEYEWRWQEKDRRPRSYEQRRWDGSSLSGKTILVYAEQGLGDTIQFVRYLRLLKEQGGRVILECPKAMMPLLSLSGVADALLEMGFPPPPFDVHAPLLSLPYLLKANASIPAAVPYLMPDSQLVERWRTYLAAYRGFRIGIAWQGNLSYGGDRHRSLPLRHFARLAQRQGVQLFGLQKGGGSEQLAEAASQFFIVDLGRQIDEASGAFMDSAAIMKNLDLIVTSDTAIPHLAGALGVPVWVALGCTSDWRWLMDRQDSPWYPSMRLFRQKELGNWDDVFERIAQELDKMLHPVSPAGTVSVEIAPGELIDKITILQIKSERIQDKQKLHHVRTELESLLGVHNRSLPASDTLARLTAELKSVNERLWRIEDDIRLCERAGDFGAGFVELARSVYHENDRRASVKRQINELLGSRIIEEKSYADYSRRPTP